MSDTNITYGKSSGEKKPGIREDHIEYGFIGKLQGLKYEYRADIRDRAALEQNFRENFDALNRVTLTNGEFARLLEEIVTPAASARRLRRRRSICRQSTLS